MESDIRNGEKLVESRFHFGEAGMNNDERLVLIENVWETVGGPTDGIRSCCFTPMTPKGVLDFKKWIDGNLKCIQEAADAQQD